MKFTHVLMALALGGSMLAPVAQAKTQVRTDATVKIHAGKSLRLKAGKSKASKRQKKTAPAPAVEGNQMKARSAKAKRGSRSSNEG